MASTETTTPTEALRDPTTYRACEGAGVGPWFDCGNARNTGLIYAWPCYGITQLRWSLNGETVTFVRGVAAEGEVVGLHKFGFKVHWTPEALTELARQQAFAVAA